MDFKCKCGRCELDKKNMDKSLLNMLQKVEEKLPFRIYLTSAIRCKFHNDHTVHAKPTSSHVKGKAVDIRTRNSRERFLILEACILADFKRIGIGKTFIHVDNDIDKDPEVVWLY